MRKRVLEVVAFRSIEYFEEQFSLQMMAPRDDLDFHRKEEAEAASMRLSVRRLLRMGGRSHLPKPRPSESTAKWFRTFEVPVCGGPYNESPIIWDLHQGPRFLVYTIYSISYTIYLPYIHRIVPWTLWRNGLRSRLGRCLLRQRLEDLSTSNLAVKEDKMSDRNSETIPLILYPYYGKPMPSLRFHSKHW